VAVEAALNDKIQFTRILQKSDVAIEAALIEGIFLDPS
jgi:hypothetical protein